MKIKRECKHCANIFEVDHWEVNRGKGRFCSRTCVSTWMSREGDYGRKKRYKAGPDLPPAGN